MSKRLSIIGAILAGLLIILAAGCDRHITSRDPVRSLPAEPPTPVQLTTQINDRAVQLSWELEDSSGVARFRVYRALADETDFTLVDSTTSYSVTLSRLPYDREVRLRVTSVNTHGTEGSPSAAVTVVTGLISITIASGDVYTNSRNVQVQLNAPSTAAYVLLSESETFDDAHAVPFQSQRSFTLTDGDGLKTVYARIIFDDGAESGTAVSDDITLDTYAEIASVDFQPSDQTFTTGDTVVFYVDGSEADGEASVTITEIGDLELNDDGVAGDDEADDGVYSYRYVVPQGISVADAEVTGDFSDAAGNSAVAVAAVNVLSVRTGPLAVSFTSAMALSSFEIELRWTQSTFSDFAMYRLYRANSAAVSETSTLITTVEQAASLDWTDTTAAAGATYYYRVYVIDSYGLSAGSDVISATADANQAPAEVIVAAGLTDSLTARLTWTRNNDRDFRSYRIYRDTSPGVSVADDLIAILSDQDQLSYDDFVPFPTGSETYYYRVYVYDRQGLQTTSNEVSVSR